MFYFLYHTFYHTDLHKELVVSAKFNMVHWTDAVLKNGTSHSTKQSTTRTIHSTTQSTTRTTMTHMLQHGIPHVLLR